jgi:hypothetical protein
MRETLNHLLSPSLEIGWTVLTGLTVISVLEMGRNLLRRVRHIAP